MKNTQLLCTFTAADELTDTLTSIRACFTLAFDSVYVLENVDDNSQLILTYNIISGSLKAGQSVPQSTISVHRKKHTNTIYTINALNALVAQKTGGVLDPSYRVDWTELKNSVLVTAHGKLKTINTKIQQIINV